MTLLAFIDPYIGRESANLNRRWRWEPVPGATRYLVTPDWMPAVYVTEPLWEHVEAYETIFQPFTAALSQGLHTISVQAEVNGVLGTKVVDSVVVRYSRDPAISTFQKQDIGLGGCIAHGLPDDLVGISYRFKVVTNCDIPPGNKIIFGGSRLKGSAGNAYALVHQFNTSRAQFVGPLCNVPWPPSFTNPGEATLWVALADYTGQDRTGLRSLSDKFSVLFSLVDGIPNVTNKSAIYQGNLNGVEGQFTLTKSGRIVGDSLDWRCKSNLGLGSGAFIQWDADIQLAGRTHRVSVVVPEEYAQYLDPIGAVGWRWEFPLFKGRFAMQFSDVQMQREGKAWEPVKEWLVNEYAGLDSLIDFGVKVGRANGQPVIELSNEAPSAYLPLGTVFTLEPPVMAPPVADVPVGGEGGSHVSVIQQGQVIDLPMSGNGFAATDTLRVFTERGHREYGPPQLELVSQYQLMLRDFVGDVALGEWAIKVIGSNGTAKAVATYTIVPTTLVWKPMITRMFTRPPGGPPKDSFSRQDAIEFVGSYYDPRPESQGKPLVVRQLFIFNFWGSFDDAVGQREVFALPSPAGPAFRTVQVTVPASQFPPGMYKFTFLVRGELGGSAVAPEFGHVTVT